MAIAIVGGGLVGSVMALSLHHRKVPCSLFEKNKLSTQKAADDGRTIAVSAGSKENLKNIGLWPYLEPNACPINDIRVMEEKSVWTLDFDHKILGSSPMGYIIKHFDLINGIQTELKKAKLIHLVEGAEISAYEEGKLIIDGITCEFDLVIAADGRNSWVRSQSGISAKYKEYGHQALVCHLTHEKPHHNTAWEIFKKRGPLALLPMLHTTDGLHQSGIVWCREKGFDWQKLSDQELAKELMDAFPYYGTIEATSQRWTYPIVGLTVNRVVDKRLALVGDAGHAMHPVAGQGVNLGWRDAEVLANLIANHLSCGLDVGSPILLKKYEKERRKDHKALFFFTDFITRLYGYDNDILSFGRQAGLAIINNVKPIKKFFMKRAMGK